MVTGVLTWHNENGRSDYPLTANDAVIKNILVDACFVQFDNFIPVLNTILVSSTSLQITLTLDLLTLTVDYLKSSYTAGIRHINLYDNANNYNKRYLGRLVFGAGANDLWNNSSNQLFTFNVPFVSTTVRSIPSTDAVYSLNGRFGDIVFSRTDSDTAIFYNANPTASWITFNAVENNQLPEGTAPVLKLLNLVAPINNNVFIGYNDIIQLASTGAGTLNISVVSPDFTPTPSISTLAS